MTTDYGSGSDPATTTWSYHSGRGWLEEKEDASEDAVSYTYTDGGRLKTRTWARSITTTYSYYANGDRKVIDYSDATPDVYFQSYTRIGQPSIVKDGTWGGSSMSSTRFTHAYVYHGSGHANHPLELYYEQISNLHSSTRYLTRKYETSITGVPNRVAGIKVGTSANGSQHYENTYSYRSNDGRLEGVTAHGDTYTYTFGQYDIGSGTDDYLEAPIRLSGPGFSSDYVYQSGRATLDYQDNKYGSGTRVSKYQYEYDTRTRRTKKKLSGLSSLFGSGKRNQYGYNDDDEVTDGDRYNALSGGSVVDAFDYTFDGIGNRLSADGPEEGGGASVAWDYTPDNTNAYTTIERDTVTQTTSYDADGNMTELGSVDFKWDAENRLIEVKDGSSIVAEYEYDYLGRRVKRILNETDTETYVYDRWQMVATYTSGATLKHTFTWSLENGTGSIGQLIACRKHTNSKDYVYLYDGHGNVTQILDQSNNLVAHYEYDPFGNLVENDDKDSSGFNDENPFRFSTKFFDEETEGYYYGYRVYLAKHGRWMNRDPIGEAGGLNLYGFVGNDPVNWVDYWGLEQKRLVKVKKCEAYLFIGHYTEGEFAGIEWDLKESPCAIGGAVTCYPFVNQPLDWHQRARQRDRRLRGENWQRWPNVSLVEGLLFGGERGERAAGYLSEANSILERDQDPETGRPAPEREMRFVFAVENALSRASKEEILRRLCNSGCCQKVKMIIEVGADKNGDLNRKVAKEWRLKYNGKTIVEYECFSKRERERYESEMKAFERGERRNRVLPMRRGN